MGISLKFGANCAVLPYVGQDERPPYDRPMKGFRPAFFQKGWMVSAKVFPRW